MNKHSVNDFIEIYYSPCIYLLLEGEQSKFRRNNGPLSIKLSPEPVTAWSILYQPITSNISHSPSLYRICVMYIYPYNEIYIYICKCF